jgi:hypothetical protein
METFNINDNPMNPKRSFSIKEIYAGSPLMPGDVVLGLENHHGKKGTILVKEVFYDASHDNALKTVKVRWFQGTKASWVPRSKVIKSDMFNQ